MSKRHHTSRRKAYGRRQHEVRERHDRGQHAEASALDLERVGLGRPPTRCRSSTRARRGSASRRATDRWPSTRAHAPRTIALPSRPRLVESPLLPPSACARAVRAHRTVTARPGLLLGLIVVAFMLAFFSLAQQVRVSATSYDIGRLQVERERLDARLQEITSDLSRLGREPAVRKLALDAGPRPARRGRPAPGPLIVGADERCWVAPIPAAASSSC